MPDSPTPVSPPSLRIALPIALVFAIVVAGPLSCSGTPPIGRGDGGGGVSGGDAPVDQTAQSTLDGSDTSARDANGDLPREHIVADNGASCSVAGDCVSGQCFDGVCCAQDCSAACYSCAIPGNVGVCLPAEVGTDPRESCADEGAPSCGTDGTCDGSGGCRKYPTGIVCKQPSCSGSTLTLAFRCNLGVCAPTSGQPCDPYMCGSPATCANSCTRDQDCTAPSTCNNGSCGKRSLGGACAVADDCNSGICQQGVCCSTTCTGTCRSCALPGSEGACTNVPARQDPLNQCDDAGVASCGTDGSCDGTGACSVYARGTACRPSAGVCDVAETCAGAGAACPPDGFVNGSVCRASAGPCDLPELCSGAAATCPADSFAPATMVCRASAGACDLPELCSGAAATCPAESFAPATMVCRASAGLCDIPEVCGGATAACPPDVVMATGTPCRMAAGLCDVTETCNGTAACPPDGFLGPTSVCRPLAGACDVPESCTGGAAECPPDGFASMTTVCRASAGVCDVAESCTGNNPLCPTDRFVVMGTICRAAAGLCDVAEICDGATAPCPPDAPAAAGVVCRPSAGICDTAETCLGNDLNCPLDTGSAPPATPTGLTFLPENAAAFLAWNAVIGATGYNIKRSTSAAGPFTVVGTSPTKTFIATGLTNGTTYFFQVSATSVGGGCESASSTVVAVTPASCPGVFCDDFESDVAGTMAVGWTRVGGSAGDWAVVNQGTQFFAQVGATSLTPRASFASGANGAPWSGAITVSANVELNVLGTNSPPVALVCPRFVDLSNYYCVALGPTGLQIQTKVNGTAVNSAQFSQTINVGSINAVSLSLSASGVLTAVLNSSVRATLTPPALPSGFVAVATVSIEAEFDAIVVTQP